MIFYIRLVHPSPQAKQRNVTGKLIQAGLHRFFGFCRAGGYAQNAFQGRHTGKTGGFQRGPKPPLWHTTLLARCSVLYLPARLTGEKWRAMRFVSRLDRQKNGAEGLPPGMRKNDGRFCRVWAGIYDDINTTNMLILLRAGTFPRCKTAPVSAGQGSCDCRGAQILRPDCPLNISHTCIIPNTFTRHRAS